MAVADVDGGDEVLVEVVDELDDAVFERGGDGEEVEGREMLHILAQANAAGVRADGNIELGGEQEDGKILVDAGDAATIELKRRR